MNNEKPIKMLLNEILKSYSLEDKVDELKLKDQWTEIVGGVIAKRTEKISVYNHKLHVWVNSAPLKQELHFHKEMIIERINTELGKKFIEDIIIK